MHAPWSRHFDHSLLIPSSAEIPVPTLAAQLALSGTPFHLDFQALCFAYTNIQVPLVFFEVDQQIHLIWG